jgi:hypothetical protein
MMVAGVFGGRGYSPHGRQERKRREEKSRERERERDDQGAVITFQSMPQ